MADVDPTASGVLRAQFGRYWRAWAWVQRQFTPASLTLVGGILAVAGGYIVHLREDYVEVRERVVVLETRVVPVIEASKEESTNRTDIDDLKSRVTRLEDNWDHATQHAGDAPIISRRRK